MLWQPTRGILQPNQHWRRPQDAGGGGGGGFALVASVEFTGPAFIASGVNTTAAIDTTGANLLIVYMNNYAGFAHSTVSDNKGNTWTALTAQDDGSNIYSRFFYCAAPIVGSGHTFSAGSGGAGVPVIAVQAWSGANASPFDVENGALVNATTVQPGSVTPSVNNSLIVCGFTESNGTGYSINGGYTTTVNDDQGTHGNEGMGLAYLVQPTAGPTNPTWTSGGFAPKSASIAVFKP